MSRPLLPNIARDSQFYAGAVVETILASAAGLNPFPQSGRIVPEAGQPGMR